MPDPYASITEQPVAVQEVLVNAIETRAADPQFAALIQSYLATIPLPPRASVLEVGCGSGPVTRVLGLWPGVALAIGVDPSPVFIAKARELSAAQPNVSFREGDGRSLPIADASQDLVVFHTSLCHTPEPERAVAEAFRVVKPGGWVAACDGDYSQASVALAPDDPLQNAVRMMFANFVHDLWLVRRLPVMLTAAGFADVELRGHGYVQSDQPSYLLTVIDRGADLLANAGTVSAEFATAMKAEARQRVATKRFFGSIPFISAIARRP